MTADRLETRRRHAAYLRHMAEKCERLAEEYRRNADRIDAAALTDGTQR
jgi:hypothetical protein